MNRKHYYLRKKNAGEGIREKRTKTFELVRKRRKNRVRKREMAHPIYRV